MLMAQGGTGGLGYFELSQKDPDLVLLHGCSTQKGKILCQHQASWPEMGHPGRSSASMDFLQMDTGKQNYPRRSSPAGLIIGVRLCREGRSEPCHLGTAQQPGLQQGAQRGLEDVSQPGSHHFIPGCCRAPLGRCLVEGCRATLARSPRELPDTLYVELLLCSSGTQRLFSASFPLHAPPALPLAAFT